MSLDKDELNAIMVRKTRIHYKTKTEMKLKELQLGDILLINGEANHRVHRFSCESSDGECYYHFPDQHPFVRFTGHEEIDHFHDNVYLLKQTDK